MKRTLLLGQSLAVALAVVGCRESAVAPSASPALRPADVAVQSSLQSASVGGIGLDRGRISLPSSWRLTDQSFADAARRAINPGDYVCPPSTAISDWWLAEALRFARGEPALFKVVYIDYLADLIPTYEAIFFATDDEPQYFGYNGQYTKTMLKTERDVKRFWDIASEDIQLIGMHGTVLTDVARTAPTYQVVFGLTAAEAAQIADEVRDAVEASNILDGGNHPLFSFNAFALTTNGGPIPDKIVMGDGVLEGYAALGFGDVAPQGVYAHEFAHHIQFENNYFATRSPPPAQRRSARATPS